MKNTNQADCSEQAKIEQMVAKRFKAWVTFHGYSITDISRITGKHRKTVSAWFDQNSNSWPSIIDLFLLDQNSSTEGDYCLVPDCSYCKTMHALPVDAQKAAQVFFSHIASQK